MRIATDSTAWLQPQTTPSTLCRRRYYSTPLRSDQEAALIARSTVWRALDLLSPRRRAIVIMYELDGVAIADIASLLGISAITVRWHLSMGRRDLTRVLKPHMGDTQ